MDPAPSGLRGVQPPGPDAQAQDEPPDMALPQVPGGAPNQKEGGGTMIPFSMDGPWWLRAVVGALALAMVLRFTYDAARRS